MDFTTEVSNEWKEVLSKTSLEYLESVQQKILFSILDLNAYYHAMKKSKEAYQKWVKPLFENKPIYDFPETIINYCSTDIPSTMFLRKINFSFYNSIHSFYDNYAQFICSCIFPLRAECTKFYLKNVYTELSKDVCYKAIYDKIGEFMKNKVYWYIIDMNDVNKHRYTISPLVTTWLNDGEITSQLPEFIKSKRHNETDMEDSYEDACDLNIKFYEEVTPLIIQYLRAKTPIE